jgi:hypothetical protein
VAAPAPAVAPPTPAAAPAEQPPPAAHRPVELTVKGAPPGARVLLDGEPLGEAPGPLAVPFGQEPVELTVTAPGREPAKVTVVPNQTLSTTVTLKKKAPGTGKPRRSISKDLENPF